MNLSNFKKPESHPYDLLGNYEKERTIAIALVKAFECGDLYGELRFAFEHTEMVKDGLFEHVQETTYKLTKKAVGLLYSVYGID